MSRLSSIIALPVGVALAAVGRQILCHAAEISRDEKAETKEKKATNSKWWLSHKQKHATSNTKQCNLTGLWENDLGSRMQVSKVDSQGNFSGVYHTAVSSAQKPIEPCPLVGSQNLDEDGQCTFGFIVNWNKFSDSTAVFVGQCFAGEGGEEILHTSWLLREKVDSLPDDWKATRTGRNVFVRVGQKEEGESSPSRQAL
ncbi:avidin-like isoform X1 [Phaenicophaeus curvirostris]|uniref:avidin-like isoform X1 n=1 Tax=Phaenicophaeus curvirostris TaxID=33595 RepID=UPI0037F0FEF0